MAYTTIDDPSAYFQTKTYTGSAGAQSITFDGNSNLQPDWIWIKERGATGGHVVTDTVRGISASSAPFLQPSSTGAEIEPNGTVANRTLTSSNTNGFTLGQDAYYTNFNNNSDTYVSWNWKAGTSFTNDASATSVGTIDSSGSVSTDAGFSIITWTGNATSSQSVAHGLGAVPKVILTKNTDNASQPWKCYFEAVGNTKYLQLNATDTPATSGVWSNTTPTSSIISISNDTGINGSGNTILAYCFAEKQGYSKFTNFTGNGSATDGTFVYLGFRASFVIIKRTDTSANWQMYDNKRDGYNGAGYPAKGNESLRPNNTDAESSATGYDIDICANGIKLRNSSSTMNSSGASHIVMAFAESPFVTSTGIPTTAR